MSKEKMLGQVFTPSYIVEMMVNETLKNFGDGILDKKILEPSCGDGIFLSFIVQHIIDECKSKKYNDEYIKKQLLNIYGWDIDEHCVCQTIERLDNLLEINNLNFKIKWNIEKKDALYCNTEEYFNNFDIIIGNPPYIKIQNLLPEQRELLKKKFRLCSIGSTNTYIAFFELAMNLLKNNGLCLFITPNAFLYTKTSYLLKEKLLKYVNLLKIIDLSDNKVFNDFGVYPVITIFNKKEANSEKFIYEKIIDINKNESITTDIPKIKLEKKTHWKLKDFFIYNNNDDDGGGDDDTNKNMKNKKNKVLLKEICDVYTGIQTSFDCGFIFPNMLENEDEKNNIYVYSRLKGWIKIERGIIKKIVKASKLKNNSTIKHEYILFPYELESEKSKYKKNTDKDNGQSFSFSIIEQDRLKQEYPLAYDYLLSIKYNLLKIKRSNIKDLWYSYGRFQGINNTFGKKIVFPNIANKPRFVLIEQDDVLFYSGFCIKIKPKYKKEISYESLLKVLNSEKMYEYIKSIGFVYSGGYYGINKNIIENFEVDLD